MRLFVIIVVIVVALITALLSYIFNTNQLDTVFKRMTFNSAENFASTLDPVFLAKLKETAESKEFQKVRDTAEEKDDEKAIENYLREKGLWDEYAQMRERMCSYIETMDDIKYLYLIVLGDKFALHDMYLLDDYDNPLYQTGNYEDREPELKGVDTSVKIEPTITTGKWGWLCSAYVPVLDKDGNIICHVGCDSDMEKIMSDRLSSIIYIFAIAVAAIGVIVVLSILFINKVFAKPIKLITEEAKKFNPEKNASYNEAGVIHLYMKNNDELTDIYEVIRTTQMNVIDYLEDMAKLEKERQRYIDILRQVESENKSKDSLLDKVSKDAYHDELTKVGNKSAYVKRVEELSKKIEKGAGKFAIAMIDLNNLKYINDYCGHKAGDSYIKGSCSMIQDVFKNSALYRIGGDEFVVVMVGEDYRNRDELVSQIRSDFLKRYYNNSLQPHQRYCASVGLAVYEDGDTVESVFKRADQAMYAEKMVFKMKNGSYR